LYYLILPLQSKAHWMQDRMSA